MQRHFNPHLPCGIECDASDIAIGTILSQKCDGHLHLITFHLRKMNKNEINYKIDDEELRIITLAIKECHRYLESGRYKIMVYSDHRGLEWFTQNKPLNGREARWALELDRFNFQIIYQPGTQNTKPDGLSRRVEHLTETGGRNYHPIEHVLKPEQWVPGNYHKVIVT